MKIPKDGKVVCHKCGGTIRINAVFIAKETKRNTPVKKVFEVALKCGKCGDSPHLCLEVDRRANQ